MSTDLLFAVAGIAGAAASGNVWIVAAVAIGLLAFFMMKGKKNDDPVMAVIEGLATGNPKFCVSQDDALKIACAADGIEKVKPLLSRIYGNSKIGTRYFAVPDFCPEKADGEEMVFQPNKFVLPIEKRQEKYREYAVPLVSRIATEALNDAGITAADVSKLVVVSSTGFLGPGLDCEIIAKLGLPRSADRTLIGFMGCAAAMNGFRVAGDYVKNNPGKYALMVCVELSSPHTKFDDEINDSILHAIFADGCAAAVLSGKRDSEVPSGRLAVIDDFSWLLEGTEDGISLEINQQVISCTLSKYLPRYISENIVNYIDMFFSHYNKKFGTNADKDSIDFWAVHPGGRRIIEAVMAGIGLTDEQCQDSWYVLDKYGNMLSPSVVFVLEHYLSRCKESSKPMTRNQLGLAFSFSPGVGVEGVMLRHYA